MPLARSRNLRPFPRRALAAGLALGALLFPGAAEIARAAVDSCPDALITADVKARLAARSPTASPPPGCWNSPPPSSSAVARAGQSRIGGSRFRATSANVSSPS